MLTYPHIDPVLLSIGPLQIRWYGLMYLLGFLLAWLLANRRASQKASGFSRDEISDLIFYGALGVIIGGRLGYMLFYTPKAFIEAPWIVFKTWEGGMSFHGGLLGVAVAIGYFAKKTRRSYLMVADFLAPLVPIGLGLGRLGNFINGELWGRVTSKPWGMVFPMADDLPRHPSQLYEFFLEGVVLFVCVWLYSSKPRPVGRVSALFLIGYALARIGSECFREPDWYLGFIAFDSLTMGQLLSLPMLLAGLWLWYHARPTPQSEPKK